MSKAWENSSRDSLLPMSEPLTADLTLVSGEGLRLRRLTEVDAPDLARISADDEVRRWSDPRALTFEQAVEVIDNAKPAWKPSGQSWLLAITGETDDTLRGTIGLDFETPDRATVGYRILPEWRGQGVATAALKLVSAWAFETVLELVRLEAWIVPGNDASVVVAERAGYTRESIARSRCRFGDEHVDVIVYAFVRDDL